MATSVRELPPLRLAALVTTPDGASYRWGTDERNSAFSPAGIRLSSTMPGGYENFDCTLPRKPNQAYPDLAPLSHVKVHGPGGEVAWEGRLERSPRVAGSESAVSPQGVGYQAHLKDDNTAQEVYIDRDLGHWAEPSIQRRINHVAASNALFGSSIGGQDQGATVAGLQFAFDTFDSAQTETGEAWYYGQGCSLGYLKYNFDTSGFTDSNWTDRASLSTDDLATSENTGTDHDNTDASGQTVTASGAAKKYARVLSSYAGAHIGSAVQAHTWLYLRVIGAHGLTLQGTSPDDGLYASDVIANAISRWAPQLTYSTGASGTIKPTSFVIPHLEFRDHTTVAEMITQANRFHLRDWAVWDDKTFHYHERGDRGRSWRARVGPSKLEETGPQVDRIWNGVLVRYQDVDGTVKTVGPTGSSAYSTSSSLLDTDPENPANKLGIRRYALLDMSITSTLAAATEVGRRFLEESKLLDSSGKAALVGTVTDDKGIVRAAWEVKAGDTISFVDASDTSARRIVRAEYDHDSRTTSIDLDSPPEGMTALLERLGVVLVGVL